MRTWVAVLTIPDNLEPGQGPLYQFRFFFQLTSPQMDDNRLNTAAKLICDSTACWLVWGKKPAARLRPLEQNHSVYFNVARGIIGDSHLIRWEMLVSWDKAGL